MVPVSFTHNLMLSHTINSPLEKQFVVYKTRVDSTDSIKPIQTDWEKRIATLPDSIKPIQTKKHSQAFSSQNKDLSKHNKIKSHQNHNNGKQKVSSSSSLSIHHLFFVLWSWNFNHLTLFFKIPFWKQYSSVVMSPPNRLYIVPLQKHKQQ